MIINCTYFWPKLILNSWIRRQRSVTQSEMLEEYEQLLYITPTL